MPRWRPSRPRSASIGSDSRATGNIIESVSPAQTGNCAGASSQWIGQNDNSDPNSVNPSGFRWHCFDRLVQNYVLPVKAAVEARGEPFVLNTCYVGFSATASFQQSSPAEYAEFVVTVLKHLKQTFNLEPDIWEARLEPDNGNTAISGAQLGAMIAAAAPAVRAAGFQKVKFAAPSTLDSKKAVPYFDAIRNTAGVAPYLAELTYHLYGSPGATTLNGIKTTAAAAGVQTAMLEYTTATASTLLADLTKAGVSSWQQYGLAGPYPNAPSLIKVDTLTESMEIRPAAYPLIQFFRHVRPGAVRIGVTSTTGTIAPVAFRNANGKFVVVANTTAGATLNVSGVPAGTYDVSFSTSAAPGAVGAPVTVAAGGVLTASIPAAGTITLSQR